MTNDLATQTAAVVLAGGKGTRLGALTRDVCKPALPFGAAYRNIDFSLSNCVNSGIRRVGIATQHKPDALLAHIDRVWSRVVAKPGEYIAAWPSETRAPLGGYRGTADAVFRNLDRIQACNSSLVLVLAGDHVYRMDYRAMLEYHRASGADATVGCIEIEAEEASRFGILSVDGYGQIERFVEKPKSLGELPSRTRVLASMGIYVFDSRFLAEVLRRDACSGASRHDFGGDVLPQLVRTARVFAYPFVGEGQRPGYWRDDGRSLIADGCCIAGTVRRSVVFSRVHVGAGAVVEDTVVLPGAVIGGNSRIRGAIVDSDVRIPDGMVIDYTKRGPNAGPVEPIVVTAEALSLELAGSVA